MLNRILSHLENHAIGYNQDKEQYFHVCVCDGMCLNVYGVLFQQYLQQSILDRKSPFIVTYRTLMAKKS